jgi:hypothetical protein
MKLFVSLDAGFARLLLRDQLSDNRELAMESVPPPCVSGKVSGEYRMENLYS